MSPKTAIKPTLADFEGREVLGASIEIPNAGGGLQEAMKITPVELHHGDRIFVVLDCEVRRLKFEPVKNGRKSDEEEEDEDVGLNRVHVCYATAATLVDEPVVADVLAEHKRRVQMAREAEEGVQRLDGIED